MRLLPAIAWLLDGRADQALDARALPLLRAIAERGTLTAAARSTGVSYRWAWGLVEDLERRVGSPLVNLERGRGARLTSLGVRLLAADERARALLATHERGLALPLRGGVPRAAAGRRLAIAASHDMALGELRETWRADHAIDIEFHGSALSLARYVDGIVDIAGFHVAHHRQGGREVLLSLLRPGRDAVIRFLRRTQGLILPHGNPRHVHALRDIATKRLRFVNRQPGSGTRILLDRLLAADGLTAAGIAGYANEEFTHAAVAATVASAKADAGFGLQAAAAAFGLAFVPVAQESYLFACRRRAVDSASIAAFRRLLAGRETREVVDRFAGYVLDAPGALAALERNANGEIVLR